MKRLSFGVDNSTFNYKCLASLMHLGANYFFKVPSTVQNKVGHVNLDGHNPLRSKE